MPFPFTSREDDAAFAEFVQKSVFPMVPFALLEGGTQVVEETPQKGLLLDSLFRISFYAMRVGNKPPLRALVEPYVNACHALWTKLNKLEFHEVPDFSKAWDSFSRGVEIRNVVTETEIISSIDKVLSLARGADLLTEFNTCHVYISLERLAHQAKSASWTLMERISRFSERVWSELSALPISDTLTHYLTHSNGLWETLGRYPSIYFDINSPGMRVFGRAGEIFLSREGLCSRCRRAGSLKCSRCLTRYCSAKCQRDAWSRHKVLCGKSSEEEITRNFFAHFPLPIIDHFDQSAECFVFRRHPTLEFQFDPTRKGAFTD